ncbi:MAG: CPXCG motif-containing cysteine-rich protein [Pseudomonadota bacterium]
MSLTDPKTFECPYCMTINDIEVDWLNDIGQQQIVDCQVCCQPIEIEIIQLGDEIQIKAHRDDE